MCSSLLRSSSFNSLIYLPVCYQYCELQLSFSCFNHHCCRKRLLRKDVKDLLCGAVKDKVMQLYKATAAQRWKVRTVKVNEKVFWVKVVSCIRFEDSRFHRLLCLSPWIFTWTTALWGWDKFQSFTIFLLSIYILSWPWCGLFSLFNNSFW